MKNIPFLLVLLTAFSFSTTSHAGVDHSISTELAATSAPPSKDDWQFSVGIPGWLPGLKGDVGIKGLGPVHVDVPFSKILEHLDMAAALSVQAQHDRWSFYASGLYMKMGADGVPPGPLVNSINVELKAVLAETGVAYRLWEGKRGYFDLLAGARLVYIDGTIHMDVNSSGVQQVSQELSSALVNQLTNAVKQQASAAVDQAQADLNNALTSAKARLSSAAAAARTKLASDVSTAQSNISSAVTDLKDTARTQVVDSATSAIQGRVDSILAKYPHLPILVERTGPVTDAIRELVDARLSAAQANLSAAQAAASAKLKSTVDARLQATKAVALAAVDARVAAARAKVQAITAAASAQLQAAAARAQAKANQAVQKAEQNLAKRIQSAITQALPTDTSASKAWVDPFVGFRARFNFTDHLYLMGRADIGGFGVSSKLDWQAYGALGWQFNRHWSTELGYRYLSIDYDRGGFVYDAALGGAYIGITYNF